MDVDCLPFKDTGYFSKLICDYLAKQSSVAPLYHRFPELTAFGAQIKERKAQFGNTAREVLVAALKQQYHGVSTTTKTLDNIALLSADTTFTVTTGHQLNLFTGPLYFLYKIVSTINLAKELKAQYSQYDFVPVYWMATEDHDFEEINYFNFQGRKIQWNRKDGGAVGRMDTSSLQEVFQIFSASLGSSTNAQALGELFHQPI